VSRGSAQGTRFDIGNLSFEISSARLIVFFDDDEDVDDCLAFGAEVRARSSAVSWPAQFSCARLTRLRPGTFRAIRDLHGLSGSWTAEEDEFGQPHATLYTQEHEPVREAGWRFGDGEADSLFFEFSGVSKFAHGPKAQGPLRLSIACRLSFDGIRCGRRPRRECEALASRFGIPFSYSQDESGISLLVPPE
jgi:hypothetical protein